MITYDEQKEAGNNTYHNGVYDIGEYCHEQSFLWGFEEGFDFCFHHQWVKCSERHPKKDGQYLVRNENCPCSDSVAVVNWDGKNRQWYTPVGSTRIVHDEMTHWTDVPPFK